MNRLRTVIALALLSITAPALSQGNPQLVNLPLSRPGEPVTLEVSILSAHIEVIGEDRGDVEIEFSVARGERQIITPSGPKPLTSGGYTLQVEAEDNHVSVGTDWRADQVRLVARIPRRADLGLSTVNDGELVVRNITGNLELVNTNGPITASGIVGSVIAESVNEDIDVSFGEIGGDNAMAFTSVNGDLTIGLPANAGVELHLDSSQGDIYSDFEVDVQPTEPVIERKENDRGIEVRVESIIVANVNGGGPVIKLKTLNGDIEISKNDQ